MPAGYPTGVQIDSILANLETNHPTIAKVLNLTGGTLEKQLLETIGVRSQDIAGQIKALMFVFEDICKLAAKDVQTLLKNVETQQWAMALKGASGELKQKILGNMSSRGAEMLNEEISFLGAVKLSSVEQVQQQIVDIVRMLEDSGQITVASSEEEEELVQ